MGGRKQIKEAHEKAVVQQFAQFLVQSRDEEWDIIQNHGDPPDGLLKRNDKYLWIEIVDVYHNPDEAHEEQSAVTPGEKRHYHTPLEGFCRGHIDFIAQRIFEEAEKKIRKEGYASLKDTYGPGVLICCERDPLFDSSIDLEFILEEFCTSSQKLHGLNKKNKNAFQGIYLLEQNGKFHRLFPLQ